MKAETKEYISMLESENKAMAEFLDQLGFNQESVDNIATGSKSLYYVYVVSYNNLDYFKYFNSKQECLKEYVELCENYYNEDDVEEFKTKEDTTDLSSVELYDKFVTSETYLDSWCHYSKVAWCELSKDLK